MTLEAGKSNMNMQESIDKHGLINPIIVKATKGGFYVVDGRKRLSCLPHDAIVTCQIMLPKTEIYLNPRS